MKRKITSLVALLTILGILFFVPGAAYAKNKTTCMNNANSKFPVNSGSTYSQITDVSPGTSMSDAGVEWACGNSTSARGVMWITDEAGFSQSNGTYTINVNAYLRRTGTTTLGVVGSVNNKSSNAAIYATNVKICARNDHSKCNSDIGIEYKDGWASVYGCDPNGYCGKDFLRASANNTSGENDFTYPERVAKIDVDGETLINEVGITELSDHGEIELSLYRGFNNGSGSYGWSNFVILAEKQESTSVFENNTRARIDVGGDGSVERTIMSGYARDAGTDDYYDTNKVNRRNTVIEFDNRLRSRVTLRDAHTATTNWYGMNETSGSSGSIEISPSTSDWTYKPVFGWDGAFNYKKVTVSLNPGESQTKCSGVTTSAAYSTVNGTSGSTYSKQCVKISRPYAYFSGSVTASVKKNSAKTDVSIPSNHRITLSDSDDGYYEISFTSNVKRSKDSAGETVATQYSAYRRDASSIVNGSSAADWTPTSATASGNTNALAEDSSQNVFTPKVTGTLKYGETRTFCSAMSYRNKQSTSDNLVPASGSEYCVTISRPKQKCSVAPNIEYGLLEGQNYGQLSVNNKNLNKTETVANGPVSIYARPTDNIRFKYDMCAGALYPIKENGLSVPVSYTASGWSTKLPTVDNSNKYLFRTEVPLVGSTFNNPRVWSSSPTPSGFMQDVSHLNGSFTSPSSGAGENYRCDNGENGFYQIAGKLDCARNNQNYNIGVLDTGSTITQKLDWNEQKVTSGANVGSSPRTATASVIVPYNYILKPYVSNQTLRIAYIGERITMYPGVAVMTRKNELISNKDSENTYATISKNTDVRYSYYFTDSAGNLKGSIHSSSETRRFNQVGFSTEHVNETLAPVTVEISDDYVVGDRVCVELSVYPYDSHDGNNDAVALQEGSNISTRRATASCLTIAKRPTMSVESSNVYSATKINTSIYSKKIVANGTANRLTFGSWAEYGVYGRVNKNFLMASGAALAYGRDGTGANTKNLNITRTNPTNNNTTVADETNSNECTFMTQTFANAECKQSEDMKKIGEISATQYEARTKDRYSEIGKNLSGVPQKQYNNTIYLDASNIDPSAYRDNASEPVGVKTNNLYLSKTPTFADDNGNHTVIYRATNVVIDGDLNKQVAKAMTTLNGVTGVIILAENVYLTDSVKYVDATIIADKVNTCAFKSSDPTRELRMSDLNANVCNQGVIFDSPVITKRLILNRTAGATNGTGSIVRAEVFNLNTGNYLWSFGQMSRYNQAVTTYSRELPPRY